MKLFTKLKAENEDGAPRRFTFELTMSGLISLFIVVLLGVTWIFMLGVWLGRGYKPEETVPELARIMPTTESDRPGEQGKPQEALTAEDLQFMEKLPGEAREGEMIIVESTRTPKAPKNPTGGASVASRDIAAAAPSASAGQVKEPATAKPKKKKQAAPAAGTAPKRPETPKAPEAPKIASQAAGGVEVAVASPESPGPRYIAVYQVASFFKKSRADAFVKKLSKKGLKPGIREAEAGGKHVYRVVVTITGTNDDLNEGLKRTGEKGPLLLSKKPL